MRPIPKERTAELADHIEWSPSWENSLASIRRIPDEVLAFGAHERDALVGTIVYYPLLNWVMNVTVRRDMRRRGSERGSSRISWPTSPRVFRGFGS